MSSRRSPYSDRLLTFPGRVFSDGGELSLRGHWHRHFADRLGKDYTGRIVLDVGCHEGHLLAPVSSDHPPIGFIGLDWSPRLLFRAAERLSARPNVALVHARAQDLARVFAAGELSQVWLFHPEPGEGPTPIAGRVFGAGFLHTLANLLVPSGTVHLKTDHPGYFQAALSIVDHPPLPELATPPSGAPLKINPSHLHRPEDLPKPDRLLCQKFAVAEAGIYRASRSQSPELFSSHSTLFEQRYHRRRRPVFYLKLVRVGGRAG
jgi:tRNA G46 methylase TrmB